MRGTKSSTSKGFCSFPDVTRISHFGRAGLMPRDPSLPSLQHYLTGAIMSYRQNSTVYECKQPGWDRKRHVQEKQALFARECMPLVHLS